MKLSSTYTFLEKYTSYHTQDQVNSLLTIMQNELLDVARKETNSILRQKDYNALSSLSFHDILDKMKNRCPTVFKILSNMLQYDVNRENTASLVLVYAVLMFRRCHELSSTQRINTVLLGEGNANREVNFYY